MTRSTATWVPPTDDHYIGISAVVQVERVMARLGSVEKGAGTDIVIASRCARTIPVKSGRAPGRTAGSHG